MSRHSGDFDVRKDVEKIKAALSDSVKDIKGKTSDAIFHSISNARQNVKRKSSDFQQTLTWYMNKKPFKTLSIAMLSGLIIGYLLKRK